MLTSVALTPAPEELIACTSALKVSEEGGRV